MPSALMDLPDLPFRYEDHGIFRHPALSLSDPLFRKFKSDLSSSIRSTRSPMEDSLVANAPAIHNEFRSVHSSVQRLDDTLLANTETIQQLKISLDTAVQQLASKAAANRQSLDNVYGFMEKIGEHMMRTARHERRRAPSQPGTGDGLEWNGPPQGTPELQRGQERQEDGPRDQADGSHPTMNAAEGYPALEQKLAMLEAELAARYEQIPPETLADVDPTMLPRNAPLQQQWDEWFKGVQGRPSLWILNKTFKSKWRKGGGNTMAKTFSFKRAIITSILQQILNAEAKGGGTLAEREERVLAFVVKGLNSGMTLNQYYLLATRKSMPKEASEEP